MSGVYFEGTGVQPLTGLTSVRVTVPERETTHFPNQESNTIE